MQILSSGSVSSTSSLVSAMPLMPATVQVWRTRQASNQPQRRGRPVTVPNSWPALAELLADRVGELGGERSLAHPRGVGLGDAEHVIERAGPDARAGRRLRRHRVRRGDEGIGAVVDVEQRALRPFEQDALALPPLGVEQRPHRIHVRQHLRRDRRELAAKLIGADLRLAQAAPQADCDAPGCARSWASGSAGRRGP